MIKISVILTTYNSEGQIQEVIDSIHKQEGRDELFELELIVVDDCSADSTTDILDSMNISFISTRKNTGGPNKGRNIAISQCKGDFICIADHDDVWFPNKISELISVSDLAPIITSGYILEDASSGRKEERVNKSSSDFVEYKKNETFLTKLTKSKIGQQTYLGSIMFNSTLRNIKFEEDFGMIDFDWVLNIFHNNYSVELCKLLYVRRVGKDNLSLNETYRINDYNRSLQTILSYKNEFSKEVALSEKRINGSMGRYYYLIGNMRLARVYFLKSRRELKTILYLITTFVGSKIVKRYFKIFG